MSRFLLGAFLCLLSLVSKGEDNESRLNQAKNDKKLAFLKYKFDQGEYEECIDGANKFAKNYDKGKISISDATAAKLLEAKSYFSMLSFEKASQIFNVALSLAEKVKVSRQMSTNVCFTLLNTLMKPETMLNRKRYFVKWRKFPELIKLPLRK